MLVDVVVMDRDGKPVSGLKQSDFTLQEDGKEQQIRAFEEVGSDNSILVGSPVPKLPINTFTDAGGAETRGPIYILVYDMVNTEPEDQATAFKPLLDFVDNLPAGTRMALYVNSDGLHQLHAVTGDRTQLHAAIDSRGSGPHVPKRFMMGENYGKGDPLFTLRELQILARNFQQIPGRKNLIWLSGEMPATLTADPNHEHSESQDAGKEALAALAHSRIALYPVDLRGVSFDSQRGVGGSAVGGETAASSPGAASTVMLQVNSDAMGTFTGGHAYRGDNNPAHLLRQALEHGRSYYTLSYTPTNDKYNYTARHISVSLADKGYTLSYRRVYYALPGDQGGVTMEAGVAAKDADSLLASVRHSSPLRHELLFQAHVRADAPTPATPEQIAAIEPRLDYFRTRRRMPNALPVTKMPMQLLHIEYSVTDPQLEALVDQSGLPAALEFAAVAYDAEGQILNGVIDDGQLPRRAKEASGNGAGPVIKQDLEVPAGAVWVRLAVRDTSTDRTGTLEIALPLAKEPAPNPTAI